MIRCALGALSVAVVAAANRNRIFIALDEMEHLPVRGVSGRTKTRSWIWANAAKPFGLVEFSGVDIEGPGVEVVNAPNVVFRDSTFAPVAMSEAEKKSRSDKIYAGVEVLW